MCVLKYKLLTLSCFQKKLIGLKAFDYKPKDEDSVPSMVASS